MAVTLVFLGRLEDVAGGPERNVASGPLETIVAAFAPGLRDAVSHERIKLARNGTLVAAAGLILEDGDELAFLPPVSGG